MPEGLADQPVPTMVQEHIGIAVHQPDARQRLLQGKALPMWGGGQAFAKPCHGVPQEQEPGILLRGRVEVEVIRQAETQGREDLLLARPGRRPRRMDELLGQGVPPLGLPAVHDVRRTIEQTVQGGEQGQTVCQRGSLRSRLAEHRAGQGVYLPGKTGHGLLLPARHGNIETGQEDEMRDAVRRMGTHKCSG